jgi:hypothetical protein
VRQIPVQALAWILLDCSLNKSIFMGGILYTIAVILIIAWAIGFLGYHSGGIIHLLLVIAIIAVILGVIRRAD